MATRTYSISAAGGSTPVTIDLANFKQGVGILIYVPTAVTVTANVEVTGDNPARGLFNWNLHDLLQNITSSSNGNLAYPVSAVRLNVSAISGGSVVFSVIQADA